MYLSARNWHKADTNLSEPSHPDNRTTDRLYPEEDSITAVREPVSIRDPAVWVAGIIIAAATGWLMT